MMKLVSHGADGGSAAQKDRVGSSMSVDCIVLFWHLSSVFSITVYCVVSKNK